MYVDHFLCQNGMVLDAFRIFCDPLVPPMALIYIHYILWGNSRKININVLKFGFISLFSTYMMFINFFLLLL